MMLGAFRATLTNGGDLFFICGFGSASVIWFLTLSTVVSCWAVSSTRRC